MSFLHISQIEALEHKIRDIQATKRKQTLGGIATAPPLRSIRSRRTLKGHFGKITALHWSHADYVVSAGQDGNLLIWNPITSNKIQSITLKSNYVMSVGMEGTQGNLVACGGLDNLCTVYPRNAPNQAVEMASHDGFLSCCRFLNEKQILTSSGDSTCILWDISSGRPVSTFAEHTADALFLAVKDRTTFASCSVDKTIRLWDVRSPKSSVQCHVGHVGDVNGVDFLQPDTFATCSQDNTVRIFDLRAYNELACYGTPVDSSQEAIPTEGYTSVACSSSGRVVFAGHAEGYIDVFDVLKGGKAYQLTQAHERHISCLGVGPTGAALCSGSWDSLLKVWA